MEGTAHFGEVGERPIEVGHLAAHELADVPARSAPGPLDGNDLPDLLQREAEASRLRDEAEERQCLVAVESVAGRAAARRREDPRSLVETQRFSTDAAPGGDLADEEAVPSHALSLNPIPRGKVKRARDRSRPPASTMRMYNFRLGTTVTAGAEARE